MMGRIRPGWEFDGTGGGQGYVRAGEPQAGAVPVHSDPVDTQAVRSILHRGLTKDATWHTARLLCDLLDETRAVRTLLEHPLHVVKSAIPMHGGDNPRPMTAADVRATEANRATSAQPNLDEPKPDRWFAVNQVYGDVSLGLGGMAVVRNGRVLLSSGLTVRWHAVGPLAEFNTWVDEQIASARASR